MTILRFVVDKPETSYAQVRKLERKKEKEKFQKIVYLNYKLEEFVYLLDVLNSVFDKLLINQRICNIL